METTKLCMFCCSSFYPSREEKGLSFHPHFIEFCSQLLDTVPPPSITIGIDKHVYSVCRNCLPLVSSSMEIKKNAAPVEKKVIRLQNQLLKELKKLECLMDEFYGEMKKIQEVIRNSEGHFESNKDLAAVGAARNENSNVSLFRRSVLRVINDLAVFKGIIGSKVTGVRKETAHFTPGTGETPSAEFDDTDNLPIIKFETEEEESSFDDLPDESMMEIEEDIVMDGNDVKMLGENKDHGSAAEISSDSDPDFKPKSSSVRVLPKSQKSRRKRTIASSRAPPHLSSKGSRYVKVNGNKLTMIQHLANQIEDFLVDPVDTDSLSPFTKKVVLRVLKRKQKVLKRRQVRESHPELVYEDHDWRRFFELHLIEYNQDKEVLTVGDIDIKIHDDPNGENFLSCGICAHQILDNPDPKKKVSNVEHLMYEHIIGAHLNAYQCTFCSASLANHQSYFVHSKRHRKEFQCDLCAKQLTSEKTLKRHKFKIHSTPEQQSSEEGKDIEPPKRYQCPQCPISLSTRSTLKDHLETHRDRQERETPCPDCGKIMLHHSMYSHRRYYCEKAANPRLTCPHCPGLSLKNEICLYFHLRRSHSETPQLDTFLCDLCPKKFKSAAALTSHTKSHDNSRPWICSKSCGWRFKRQKNLKRHESLCQGKGSSHRPAGGKKFQQSFDVS